MQCLRQRIAQLRPHCDPRRGLFPHDWQQALPKYNGFLVQAKAVIQSRKKLEAEPARELMFFKRLGVPPWRQLAEPRMRFADQSA
jgi:hypothetical protein